MATLTPPPIMDVVHFELTPADGEANKLASICPACHFGTLGVIRDPETLMIREYDCCLFCGQRVRYLDVAEMREKDWAGK